LNDLKNKIESYDNADALKIISDSRVLVQKISEILGVGRQLLERHIYEHMDRHITNEQKKSLTKRSELNNDTGRR